MNHNDDWRRAVHIRDALIPDEAPLLRELFREYAGGVAVDLCFQGFDEEVAGLPGKYVRPKGGLWLATVDDEIAGCAALREIDSERAEMKRLYVRRAFRGLSLGRRLTEHVVTEAAAAGYRRICLDTLPQMREAIPLYLSLGFVEIEPYCENPVAGALFLGRELP